MAVQLSERSGLPLHAPFSISLLHLPVVDPYDAVLLISPLWVLVAGAGANLAMQDGAALALEIVEASDPADAIPKYEAAMFKRAAPQAQQSAEGLEMCFSDNSAVRLADFFASAKGG